MKRDKSNSLERSATQIELLLPQINNHVYAFKREELPGGRAIWIGRLPDSLNLNTHQFETLWRMHPEEFHEIRMRGRLVKTPRWQQAYGVDYHYSARVNKALTLQQCLSRSLVGRARLSKTV